MDDLFPTLAVTAFKHAVLASTLPPCLPSDIPFSEAQTHFSLRLQEDKRLGFAFDGGVEYGILLTIRQIGNIHVISTTNREIRPVRAWNKLSRLFSLFFATDDWY